MSKNCFGENLKRIRKEKGLTQAQLADLIMTNRVSICEWETGRKYPQILWVYALADKLGVEISDLMDKNVVNSDTPQQNK